MRKTLPSDKPTVASGAPIQAGKSPPLAPLDVHIGKPYSRSDTFPAKASEVGAHRNSIDDSCPVSRSGVRQTRRNSSLSAPAG